MSSIQGFSADLDKFAKQIEIETYVLIKQISLYIFRGVVLKTPVKDGRAMASWMIGIRKRDLTIAPDIKAEQGLSKAAIKAAALRKAMKQTSKLKDVKGGYPLVYITNNLPYIKRLEDGWSKEQLPEGGMIRLTMVEAQQYIKSLI